MVVTRPLDEHRRTGPLKTASRYRTLPLPAIVADVLAAHLASEGRPEGLLFVAADGQPVKRNSFTKVRHSALRRAGPDERLRLHDLRHAYASALIHAGESVKVVQAYGARFGHGHPRRLRAPVARL